MLSWTGQASLMMVALAPISAFAAAREQKVGVASAILCVLGGLVFGAALAKLSTKLAYSALRADRTQSGPSVIVYLMIPSLGILAAAFLPLLMASIFFGRV